jgi:hypothetical protein
MSGPGDVTNDTHSRTAGKPARLILAQPAGAARHRLAC